MTVHFIGAGPGAADLITLRAQRLLAACPVCLYAGSLVPEEVLAHCPPGARLVDTADLTLDEIVAELVAADAAASTWRGCAPVTRRCSARSPSRSAGSTRPGAYDIVPGVPAYAAAAAALGRELTVPGVGQTVILTRTAARATPMPRARIWPPSAHPGRHWCCTWRCNGSSRSSPSSCRATARTARPPWSPTPAARRDRPAGHLADIAAQTLAAGVRRTAVIIVGRVLAAEGFRDSHLYSLARDRSPAGRRTR